MVIFYALMDHYVKKMLFPSLRIHCLSFF